MEENVAITASSSTSTEEAVELLAVALGKDVKESDKLLRWALHNNSRGRRKTICVLHVHQPAQKMLLLGSKVPISLIEESRVEGYHETERQEMHKILDKHVHTCQEAGARAVKLWIEMDSIEEGIVQLISEHGIKWLVMGAGASKSFSRKTMQPKSKKAIYVHRMAPMFCHIWFISKGNLIHTRQSESTGVEIAASPAITDGLRSVSVAEGEMMVQGNRGDLSLDYRRVRSASHEIQLLAPSTSSGDASSRSSFTPEAVIEWDILPQRSLSVGSRFSTCSSSELTEAKTPQDLNEGSEIEFDSPLNLEGDLSYLASSSTHVEQNRNSELYEKLDQFFNEAETLRRELFEESMKRKKAEKEAIDAIRRANASETMYAEELRRRKEREQALIRSREAAHKANWQLHELTEQLRFVEEQKSSMERQLADSNKMVQQLEQKMFSDVDLFQKYKKERDEMEVERDSAIKEVQMFKEKQADTEASSSSVSEFSLLEIEEGTSNFSQALKIGEGGFGSIYKACLRYTQVAVKVLKTDNTSQGPSEFQQEVKILSKVRHPNLINLIGACPEVFALVYEYLPNGSLEDRLTCKNNTPPLPWQTRICIAAELCSALMFLHSCQPQGIVHGDLKPSNILLDANFVSKLSDFGICRVLPQESGNYTTRCCITDPKGTLVYLDPVFLRTGELTSKSDVYSFGIILLRLLTGMSALGIVQEVQYAMRKGTLKNLLDTTAGDWPYVQAEQLANLARRCSDMERRRRPNLASEVWRVLEPMRASCGVSSFGFGSQASRQRP